jgi:hypothetical protein
MPALDIYEVLITEKGRLRAVERLLHPAKQYGGPSNLTCIVADVLPGVKRHSR